MRIVIAVLLMLVTSTATVTTDVKAEEMLLIGNGDSDRFKAFAAGPETSKVGVLIVHDWFGVSDLTRASVDRLADKGVRAVAIDLYDGRSAQTHEDAQTLSSNLDSDYAQAGVRAGLAALKADQRLVAVVGYSMGGKIALEAASENPNLVKAVAVIYGGGFDAIDDQRLAAVGPVLAVSGSADEWSYPALGSLEKRMHDLGHPIEVYSYPGAAHAFAQPLYNDGKSYDKAATMAMRNVLDAFLQRHLGAPSDK